MGKLGRYRTYLAKGLLIHEILLLLGRSGVLVEPYRFYSERNSDPVPIPPTDDFGEFEFFEASAADTDALAALNPNHDQTEEIRKDFVAGRRCFALRHAGRVVAASWCDLREIDFDPCRRPLGLHEAYLYRLMTLFDWRGRSLAPYLRSRTRQALLAEGRQVAYSFTDSFNRPAIRFKEKLGARVEFTGMYVKLFRFPVVNLRRPGGERGTQSSFSPSSSSSSSSSPPR